MIQIEHIPIDQLKPNPNNPRVNDNAVDAVARSIAAGGINSLVNTFRILRRREITSWKSSRSSTLNWRCA